jgi:hypothetical protein
LQQLSASGQYRLAPAFLPFHNLVIAKAPEYLHSDLSLSIDSLDEDELVDRTRLREDPVDIGLASMDGLSLKPGRRSLKRGCLAALNPLRGYLLQAVPPRDEALCSTFATEAQFPCCLSHSHALPPAFIRCPVSCPVFLSFLGAEAMLRIISLDARRVPTPTPPYIQFRGQRLSPSRRPTTRAVEHLSLLRACRTPSLPFPFL